MISIDKFLELDIKIGEILSVEKIPETDKLLKLEVDLGPAPASGSGEAREGKRDIRQIVSGIALYFPDPQVLVGKKVPFLTNLEPRILKGIESQGMILATNSEEIFSLLEANSSIPNGSRVK